VIRPTAVGAGAKVPLLLDGAAGRRPDADLGPTAPGQAASGHDREVDELARRSLHWLVLVSIGQRLALTVPAASLNVGTFGAGGNPVVPLAAAVVLADGVFLLVAARWPQVVRSSWTFLGDVAFLATMTVTATTLIPQGTFGIPGMDAMTGYAWGTIALWTAVRGPRTGMALLAGLAVSLPAMAYLNDTPWTGDTWFNFTLRIGFGALNLALAAAVAFMATRSARLVTQEGIRRGRLCERVTAMRELHDTVLAGLDAAVLLSRRTRVAPAIRLSSMDEVLHTESARLGRPRTTGGHETVPSGWSLVSALRELAGEFRGRGLRVDVTDLPRGAPIPDTDLAATPVTRAIVDACREALNNVAKHAASPTATISTTVTTDATGTSLTVTVTDHGVGFDTTQQAFGRGVEHSLDARLRQVGGTARIRSSPGHGTAVILRGPVLGSASQRHVSAEVEGENERALRWLTVIPFAARAAVIPMVVFIGVPSLADHWRAFVGAAAVLAAGNLWLWSRARHGRIQLLRTVWAPLCDFAVTAAWLLWTAYMEQPGEILEPNADAVWTYVVCTVAIWTVVRGFEIGAVTTAGYLLVLYCGVRLGRSDMLRFSDVALFADHALLAAAPLVYAALVNRMARRGASQAAAESERAGHALEQLHELAALRARITGGLQTLCHPNRQVNGVSEQSVRRLAVQAAELAHDIRTFLDQPLTGAISNRSGNTDLADDPTDDPDVDALATRLMREAERARHGGVRMEVIITEYASDPPAPVGAAMTGFVQAVLACALEQDAPPALTVRLTGTRAGGELTIRSRKDPLTVPGPEVRTLHNVGASLAVEHAPSGGTLLLISWAVHP
jgi:hypothetical protein